MKKIHLFIVGLAAVCIIGCDATQRGDGIVLDAKTRQPLDSVAYGKGETDDGNPFHTREYTGKDGEFHFSRVGGSNTVEIFFSKPGYKTTSKKFNGNIDTILMEKQ